MVNLHGILVTHFPLSNVLLFSVLQASEIHLEKVEEEHSDTDHYLSIPEVITVRRPDETREEKR